MYFVVTYFVYDYDWEDETNYYFKTEKEADSKVEELKNEKHFHSYDIDKKEITFDELKEMITVAEFEELMGIEIKEDGLTKLG